jgi:glycosyltransferase involved in cell wall biosynthesis
VINTIGLIKNTYPDIKCYFAGEPPENKEEYLCYLKDIVKETKTENNIFFLGNVSDIPTFLSSIDIFVLPSRYEGFGISLVEAMAAGIPCIASNLDGPKEIIKDKYGLLFELDNYQDLANKILYCISNMKNYDKDKVQNYVKENYNIKNMTKKLYNLYK